MQSIERRPACNKCYKVCEVVRAVETMIGTPEQLCCNCKRQASPNVMNKGRCSNCARRSIW